MQKHLNTRQNSHNADRLQRGVSFVSGVLLRRGLVSMTFEVGKGVLGYGWSFRKVSGMKTSKCWKAKKNNKNG